MSSVDPSSRFTKSSEPFGPPLIGALLRMPWETVQRHMLERLHEHGFDDLDAAHLNVFQYPGPQGARPSELAARLRISKQAQRARQHAPRVPSPAGQLRADLLWPRGPGARSRSRRCAALRGLAD